MAAPTVSVRVQGVPEVVARLQKAKPRSGWLSKAMERSALLIQAKAATETIIRGRGNAPPLPDKLSARTLRLTSSIAVDRRGLPQEVSVGTAVVYGAVHEVRGRPWLGPAVDLASPSFERIFTRAWSEAIG